ncbi:hypothetical protein BV25DRAFT_1914570 [Artomyces pyxidatus]|uniref:Uncharacterized protein n=1 Tax=Artomyces pyxidatus TaxID=48021 RepID=A0ACB8T6Q2_9AGAM|nr:hypothetical protein BV25DRAFT_1914570 [Artomyces pyxidatus]
MSAHATTLDPPLPGSARQLGHDGDNDFGDPSSKLWSVYLGVSDTFDKDLVENWKGDMDGILIFTGLFSASVSAFILQSYQGLQQDPNTPTIQLLTQIAQQVSRGSDGSQSPALAPSQAFFKPPTSMVVVNVFWFLSLILSVSCALGAILVQQWFRRYLRTTQHPSPPHRRARTRAYVFYGVERFHLVKVAESIPMLLHASVFLFFAGLVVFLFTVNDIVAWIVLAAVICFSCAYFALTVFPIVHANSPYQTPLSSPCWSFLKILVLTGLWLLSSTRRLLSPLPRQWQNKFTTFIGQTSWLLEGDIANRLYHKITRYHDHYALAWVSRRLYDDTELGPFIEGIPGYLKSPRMKNAPLTLWRLLGEQSLGRRITTLLMHCGETDGLPPAIRTRRALTYLHTIWQLTDAFRKEHLPYAQIDDSRRILFALKRLREDSDPTIAIAAHCTAILRVPPLLAELGDVMHRDGSGAGRFWMWMPRSHRHFCGDPEGMLRDGRLTAISDLADCVLPLLASVPEGNVAVVWDTMNILVYDYLRFPPASSRAQTRFVSVLGNAIARRAVERERLTVPTGTQTPYTSDQPPYETLARMLLRVADFITDEQCIADVARMEGQLPSASAVTESGAPSVVQVEVGADPLSNGLDAMTIPVGTDIPPGGHAPAERTY